MFGSEETAPGQFPAHDLIFADQFLLFVNNIPLIPDFRFVLAHPALENPTRPLYHFIVSQVPYYQQHKTYHLLNPGLLLYALHPDTDAHYPNGDATSGIHEAREHTAYSFRQNHYIQIDKNDHH
jgi:hypothetical protein